MKLERKEEQSHLETKRAEYRLGQQMHLCRVKGLLLLESWRVQYFNLAQVLCALLYTGLNLLCCSIESVLAF